MAKKYFGTDGIRGLVGEGVITPNFIMQLGWAAGRVFAKKGPAKILIGKDTRISGYMFESALEAGLSAAGADVRLLGPMPTPAIAYLTRTFHAAAGIVISASHNPYHDNGIKFFSAQGAKLPDELEHEIERYIDISMDTVPSDQLGKVSRIDGARGRYIEFCKSTIPYSMYLDGLKVVLDSAHGATYHIAPAVFEELGAEVVAMGIEPDGININTDCGSTSPQKLAQAVLQHSADVGIAFDGDGDRVIMVDHRGNIVDGDDILYVIARDGLDTRRFSGGVAGTLMSNFGLELAFRELGVDFVRAKVGDRYVMEELVKRQWRLGGETSGHILCLDKTTTGDGIISALQVIASMVRQEADLETLVRPLQKMPQKLINVRTPQAQNIMQHPSIREAINDAESSLAGKGRVLLRPSGTEPLLRVMVEGEDESLVQSLAENIASVVEAAAA